MMKLVAAPVLHRKFRLPRTDTGQFGREIADILRHDVHHFAFALDTALDAEHAGQSISVISLVVFPLAMRPPGNAASRYGKIDLLP